MKKLSAPLLVVLSLSTAGCATVFAGGAEPVTFTSEPAGARVTTQYGHTLGTTPFTTRLDPAQDYLFTFQKQGYAPTSHALEKKIDGVTFLNLICLVCWVADIASGSMWGFSTNTVNVHLSPAVAQLTPEQLGAVNFGVDIRRFLQQPASH